MEKVKVKGITVDQCSKCEGCWFDSDKKELLRILRLGYDKLPDKLKKSWTKDAGRLTSRKSRKYNCPICGYELATYWYTAEKGLSFLVDGCKNGCGVWLDDGELEKAQIILDTIAEDLKETELKEGIFTKLWKFFKY